MPKTHINSGYNEEEVEALRVTVIRISTRPGACLTLLVPVLCQTHLPVPNLLTSALDVDSHLQVNKHRAGPGGYILLTRCPGRMSSSSSKFPSASWIELKTSLWQDIQGNYIPRPQTILSVSHQAHSWHPSFTTNLVVCLIPTTRGHGMLPGGGRHLYTS